MFDYDEIASTAQELIEEFGAPVILRRLADAEYDTTTGVVEGTDRRWSGVAVRIEYSLRDVDGEAIQMNDFRMLIGATSMEQPRPGDRLLFAGDWVNVVNCKPTKPATIAVCYDVHARK